MALGFRNGPVNLEWHCDLGMVQWSVNYIVIWLWPQWFGVQYNISKLFQNSVVWEKSFFLQQTHGGHLVKSRFVVCVWQSLQANRKVCMYIVHTLKYEYTVLTFQFVKNKNIFNFLQPLQCTKYIRVECGIFFFWLVRTGQLTKGQIWF